MRIPGIGQTLASQIATFKDFNRAEQELEFVLKNRIETLFFLDNNFPKRLSMIEDGPILLYKKGPVDLNKPKCVGIVGTRRATEYGKLITHELVEALKPTGCLILSGLALGIDGYAHKAALDMGLPTVGVLAHGLDRIYPYQHRAISGQMLEQGGLITEFPSGTKPDKVNFPQRNRIVAGLCDVLVVIETALKGGAMITAEIANSYNKDIMALPGRTTDEVSSGCNHLIKTNKAAILTSPHDLYELMNWDLVPGKKKKNIQPELFSLNAEESDIVQYIRQRNKAGIDDLTLNLSIESGKLTMLLLDLEFRNIIRTLPGKYFELV